MPKAAAALIIENILSIEEAIKLMNEEICPNLFSSINEIIEKWAIENNWDGSFDLWNNSGETYLIPLKSQIEDSDTWISRFDLGMVDPEDELWLTLALGARTGRLGFRFSINRNLLSGAIKQRPWRAFATQINRTFDEIEKSGFQFEPSDGTWFLPWKIDAESFAENYINDALQDSLDPIREALNIIRITYPYFEKIIAAAQRQFSTAQAPDSAGVQNVDATILIKPSVIPT